MANLLAVMTHCEERGSEMLLGDWSHLHLAEQGASTWAGGVHSRSVKTNLSDGTLDLVDLESKIRNNSDDSGHYPRTRLICLETTHNGCGGTTLPVEHIHKVAAIAKKYGVKLHMDGARLWNAAVALNLPPAKVVDQCDSVSVCLSKGLAAPVGSLLTGRKDFIERARRMRKGLGGGMRQVGVLAAPGLISITTMLDRLHEDHTRAKHLSSLINKISGMQAFWGGSNMVLIKTSSGTAAQLINYLREQRILAGFGRSSDLIRLIVTYHVTDEDVDTVAGAIKKYAESGLGARGKL